MIDNILRSNEEYKAENSNLDAMNKDHMRELVKQKDAEISKVNAEKEELMRELAKARKVLAQLESELPYAR